MMNLLLIENSSIDENVWEWLKQWVSDKRTGEKSHEKNVKCITIILKAQRWDNTWEVLRQNGMYQMGNFLQEAVYRCTHMCDSGYVRKLLV